MRVTLSGGLVVLALQIVKAATDAVAVELQPVDQGLQSPLQVAEPPDGSGRLFVVERQANQQIVTCAGPGGGPHVRAFTAAGAALHLSFMAY